MKSRNYLSVLAIAVMMLASSLTAAEVGDPAPAFTLAGPDGQKHSLSDYQGKFVVLEWVNYDCPFVKKFYAAGKMQELQKHYTAQGVAWLAICSSAEGKQGHFTREEIARRSSESKAAHTAYLVDADGKVGKAYGAKSTPHMFVIDPAGKLIYAGAIDSIKSTNSADIPKAENYVAQALDEALSGKPVSVPSAPQYGCSVKYAD